jgi:hypothetical protein
LINKLLIGISFLGMLFSPMMVAKNMQMSLEDEEYEEVQTHMFAAASVDALLENHASVGRKVRLYNETGEVIHEISEYISAEGYGYADADSFFEIEQTNLDSSFFHELLEDNLFGISKNETEEILSAQIYDDELRVRTLLDTSLLKQELPQLALDEDAVLYCVYSLDWQSYELQSARVFEEKDDEPRLLRIEVDMCYDCTDLQNYLGG